jgi:hypothetical protein
VEFPKIKDRGSKTNHTDRGQQRNNEPCVVTVIMGPRADKHDDVYDRQIRLWGADAQVSMYV